MQTRKPQLQPTRTNNDDDHKILLLTAVADAVELKLNNGVKINIVSHPGYVYLGLSGIDADKPIEVVKQCGNQLDVNYTTKPYERPVT